MLVDLHTHSNASDGQYSPSDLTHLVYNSGIELWSLTDHDTIDGVAEAASASATFGIDFVPGIEISTQDITEIHILGYGIDTENPILNDRCSEFQKARSCRGERIRVYLAQKGIDIDLEEVVGYAEGNVLARPHFARYLVEHGYVPDRKSAFDRYLDTEDFKKNTDRRKPHPEETIELIHQAGGLAVLAHPGNYHLTEEVLINLLGRLSDMGLDGIECIYSGHSESQTNQYLRIMHLYDLKTGCGSDYHGEKVKPNLALGMNIDDSMLQYLIWKR